MDKIMEIVQFLQAHWSEISGVIAAILQAIAAIIGVASVVVKLTPTLKDDNALLPVVKFIGRYIALNKTVSDADRPK